MASPKVLSNPNQEQPEYSDKLVAINRVAKVVKGGRRFGFAALVVAGDGKGKVGFGKGKAKEVMEAKQKATETAKKSMIKVPLRESRTLHHDVRGRFGAGKVVLRSAPPGTGIIAGGPMRAVFESLGIQDIVAKSTGTSNPYNMVRATFDALQKLQSPKMIAARRSKKVSEIVEQRESGQDEGKRENQFKVENKKDSVTAKAKKADTKKEEAPKEDKKEVKEEKKDDSGKKD